LVMGTRAGHPERDDRRHSAPGVESAAQTPPPPPQDQPGPDLLGETKADLELVPTEDGASGSPDGSRGRGGRDESGESAADIDLTEVYDRPEKTEDASLKRYDPEAGKMGLAVKIRAVRQQVNTPFGRLVLALAVNLASACLVIYTIAFPIWPLIVAAAIVVPACGWLLWVRYQQWLGYKRYMYRLLETLGEDVSDWNMEQTYRAPKVKRAKR
jgi:hypothetical protein